jgi:hypothetical protein
MKIQKENHNKELKAEDTDTVSFIPDGRIHLQQANQHPTAQRNIMEVHKNIGTGRQN